MAKVQTVLGPIDSSQLGVTLMHEHCAISWHGWELDSAEVIDFDPVRDKVVDCLKELRDAGASTLVDATAMGAGTRPEFLADVSERSGVNIICVTGISTKVLPRYFGPLTTEQVTETYLTDLTVGIRGSGIRAGLVKATSHYGTMDDVAKRYNTAAARAAKQAGVPIITHTDSGTGGDEQLEVLVGAGMLPSRVMIGHSCCNADMSYHRKLFKAGAYVGFDRIGLEMEGTANGRFQPDEVRLACMIGHIKLGYVSQIMISTDGIMSHFSHRLPDLGGMFERRPAWLLTDFVPRLRAVGATEQDIHQIMVANPRRFFEGASEV